MCPVSVGAILFLFEFCVKNCSFKGVSAQIGLLANANIKNSCFVKNK